MPDIGDIKLWVILLTNGAGFVSLFATARANLKQLVEKVGKLDDQVENLNKCIHNGLSSRTVRIEEKVMSLHRDVDDMKKLTDRVAQMEARDEVYHGPDRRHD